MWKAGKLASAGLDNLVNFYDETLTIISNIQCKAVPRAVDFSDDLTVVGDWEGTITLYQGTAETKTWKSHHLEETWGLDLTDELAITAGDDNKILIWNYNTHELKAEGVIDPEPPMVPETNISKPRKLPDNQCSRALAYNSVANEVAIATMAGTVNVKDMSTVGTTKYKLDCGTKRIQCIRYSPDGNFLAVGSDDTKVRLFRTSDYSLVKTFDAHKTPIQSIDWDVKCTYLRTLDEKWDMLFWKVDELVKDDQGPANTKDTVWATQSSKVGWHVLGIYPPGQTKTFVNSVCKSSSPPGTLLATGDNRGLVNVLNCPCPPKSKCCSYR